LSISGIEKSLRRHILAFLGAAAFGLLLSTVYNLYSHGVHSFFMSFLFLWPLLGAVWYGILAALRVSPHRLSKNLMNAGIATVTAGSLLRGIFEIAGTSSAYQNLFFTAGVILIFWGLTAFALQHRRPQV